MLALDVFNECLDGVVQALNDLVLIFTILQDVVNGLDHGLANAMKNFVVSEAFTVREGCDVIDLAILDAVKSRVD